MAENTPVKGRASGVLGDTAEANNPTEDPAVAAPKSKRVRTGCLTCRERHLKCDETVPDCLNCRKSNRECKRGVRLNFIDLQVRDPPYMPPPPLDWTVQFQDESRVIASEYVGGRERYAPPPDGPETAVDTAPKQQQRSTSSALRANSKSLNTLGAPTLVHRSAGVPLPTGHTSHHDAVLAQTTPAAHEARSRRVEGVFAESDQPPEAMTGQAMTGRAMSGPGPPGQYSVGDNGLQPSQRVPTAITPPTLAPQDADTPPVSLAKLQAQATRDEFAVLTSSNSATDLSFVGTEEEIHYMQVYVNEVAVWMDSFDKDKHFSRVAPFLALRSPMLLNAFLACGVMYLTKVDESFNEDKALLYYNTATSELLCSLQNPDRNMAECATTAAVLNVYEIMSDKPAQRMNHIAGARALIRECGWSARSSGIAAACFWLNIGMEVLSCLAFQWQTAWNPDEWGINADFTTWGSPKQHALGGQRTGLFGAAAPERVPEEEDIWVHRILYILAKITNFRANIPRFQEPSPYDEQLRHQSRCAEWSSLMAMCDVWENMCPRSMRPLGYVAKPSRQSLFPNIWLIKRASIIGRLFYHTAMCLLVQISPLTPRSSKESRAAQIRHAHQVCGIVAHTRDRGVASAALRSLAIASSVLADFEEQKEVLAIMDRISKDSGWKLGRLVAELERAWGWGAPSASGLPAGGAAGAAAAAAAVGVSSPSNASASGARLPIMLQPSGQPQPQNPMASASSAVGTAPAPAQRRRPLVNPLLVQADFNHPNHPYQNWYAPPSRASLNGYPSFRPG